MEVHTYILDSESYLISKIPLENLAKYLEKMKKLCPNTTIALIVKEEDIAEVSWEN